VDTDLLKIILNLSVVFFAGIIILVYIRFNYKTDIVFIMFTTALIGIAYTNFTGLLIVSSQLLNYPHFFRTGALVSMAVVPLIYLITEKIYLRRKFTPWHFLHLIPFFIYFFNFASLFILPVEQKRELLEILYRDDKLFSYGEGNILSGFVVLNMRFLQILVYALLVFWISLKMKKTNKYSRSERLMVGWITVFMIFLVFFGIFSGTGLLSGGQAIGLITIFPLISLLAFVLLFFYPEVLYGNLKKIDSDFKEGFLLNQETELQLAKTQVDSIHETSRDPQVEGQHQIADSVLKLKHRNLLQQIEKHINKNQSFLSEDFSLTQLEQEVGVSSKQISLCIKKGYGKNFTRFINEKRVNYFIQNIKENPAWRKYSNEMLAFKCGFKSPNSFYAAFKDFTDKTPRQYIEEITSQEFL
jgi:AraC-like DNA-binding protein